MVEEEYLAEINVQHLLGRMNALENIVRQMLLCLPPDKMRLFYYQLNSCSDQARNEANQTASDIRIDFANGYKELTADISQSIEEFIAEAHPDEEVPDWESMKAGG